MTEFFEREEIEAPEDGITYPKMLKRCRECMHLRIRLFHDHPIHVKEDPELVNRNVSWLVAEEHAQEIYCEKGRLRYRGGGEKSYKSKHAMRMVPDIDADCPDYDPDEEI